VASVEKGIKSKVILKLPYPPSNNRYYRHNRGRIHISTEGRGYRLDVMERRPRTGWPMLGRLRMLIEVVPARTVSQDLDNIPKCICDALQHAGIYYNDSQIDDLRVVRKPKGKPHVVVTLEDMNAEA
jgi:crossover junction endodeoxyribonuclease RusA